MAFELSGLQWSQVQWLVAAISVGLGFGSAGDLRQLRLRGSCALFERPIRIGDTVTVGDITGKVLNTPHAGGRRSPTGTCGSRSSPTKEFVTTRVINWTLSTTV